MSRIARSLATFGAVAALVLAGSGIAQAQSEQVVFTTPAGAGSSGTFTFDGVTKKGPLGFWIWCQNPSTTNTPYTQVCSGSIYFYAFTTLPEIAVSGSIVETSTGLYTMTVSSSGRLAGVVSNCTLSNTSPATHTPSKQTVSVLCPATSGISGSGSANATVVIDTL